MALAAGLALGLGVGLVAGIAIGVLFLKETSTAMITAVERSTFAVAYPHTDKVPVTFPDLPTEHAFDPQDTDEELMPDWMDEDYPMAGNS